MVKVISTTTAALLLSGSFHQQHIIGVTGSAVSSIKFSGEIIENNNEPNEYYYTYETTEEEEEKTIDIEKGEDISRDTFVTSQVVVNTDTRYYDDDTVTSATRPPKPPTITSADGDGGDSWGGSGSGKTEQTSEDMSMKQSWWSGSGKSGKSGGSRYDYDCDEWGTSGDSWSGGGKSGKSGYSSSSGSWGSTSGDYMMSMPPKTMMTSEDDGSSWRSLRSDTWEGSSSSSVMPPKTMMTSEDDGQQWGGSSHSMPNTSSDSWGEWKPKSAKAFSKGGKSGGWWPEKDHSMSIHSWGSGKSGKSGSKCGKVRDREVYISYA